MLEHSLENRNSCVCVLLDSHPPPPINSKDDPARNPRASPVGFDVEWDLLPVAPWAAIMSERSTRTRRLPDKTNGNVLAAPVDHARIAAAVREILLAVGE